MSRVRAGRRRPAPRCRSDASIRRGGQAPCDAILDAGITYGKITAMRQAKITVHVPQDLLERAQKTTGRGITETVRQGLRLVAAGDVYRRVAGLRGAVKFSVDLTRLREDRG